MHRDVEKTKIIALSSLPISDRLDFLQYKLKFIFAKMVSINNLMMSPISIKFTALIYRVLEADQIQTS